MARNNDGEYEIEVRGKLKQILNPLRTLEVSIYRNGVEL